MKVDIRSGSLIEPLIQTFPILNNSGYLLVESYIDRIQSTKGLTFNLIMDLLLIYKINNSQVSNEGMNLIFNVIEYYQNDQDLPLKNEILLKSLLIDTCPISEDAIELEGIDSKPLDTPFYFSRAIIQGFSFEDIIPDSLEDFARRVCVDMNAARNIDALRELFVLKNFLKISDDQSRFVHMFVDQAEKHLTFIAEILDDKTMKWELSLFNEYC